MLLSGFQALKICSGRSTFVKAQMNEVTSTLAQRLRLALYSFCVGLAFGPLFGRIFKVAGSSSNDAAPAKSNVEIPEPKEKDPPSVPMSEEAVSEFMTQVASLVKYAMLFHGLSF